MLRAKPTGLLLAALVSLMLHIAVLVPVILRMGGTATEPPDQAGPTEQGTIEFLPVEAQGSGPQPSPTERQAEPVQAQATGPVVAAERPSDRQAEQQTDPVEAQREAQREPQKEALADVPSETPPEADIEPTEPAHAEAEPAPQPSPPPPATPPAPPPAQQASALTMNLAGTDSETNAIVTGENIIPASPDDRTRNRPPIYPVEAARRGQQGTVIVVINVSPLGLTAGAEVVRSSGYPSLDKAVLDAVWTWRFRPAIRDGLAVPFDMPMQFVFSAQ